MTRLNYALPVDVLRRFDPQVTRENLRNTDTSPEAGIIGNDDWEKVASRIEGVEDDWDRQAQPMRETRIGGSRGVFASAEGKGFPIRVYLEYGNVCPFDSSKGDFLERRTGRDNWADLTHRETNAWTANYRKGKIQIFTLPGRGQLPMVLDRFRDRFAKLSYRVGFGGERSLPGETVTSEAISQGQTTVTLDQPKRLPPERVTVLIDGEEYADVRSTETGMELVGRGVRGTSDMEHDSGARVHYCPMNVREAVASKTARELVLYDDWTDHLTQTGDAPAPKSKLEEWQSDWDQAIHRYSSWGYQ